MRVPPARLNNTQELASYREAAQRKRPADFPCIRVCMTGCRAIGSDAVLEALQAEVARQGCADKLEIRETGCHGFCAVGPVVGLDPHGFFYQQVSPKDAEAVVTSALTGEPVEKLLHRDLKSKERKAQLAEVPFFQPQQKIVLRNCGLIDPCQIGQYIAREGYAALAKVLAGLSPEQVVEEVKTSGLRGRGGAGFGTGQKWHFARIAAGETKYVVCNGDEGDPGAFMDRAVLEGDPHSVIEGMLICGYAIGAKQGFLYVRAEYPIAVRHLKIALRQAEELGLLGDNILGSGFNFRLEIREGAGAFVCGEETALIASLEGKRGMPRPRPPFPAQSGLWGCPTNINNVESFANIAPIILRGGPWYAALGTERSKGTKVFALAGQVRNTGLVEVPMGMSLKQIIFEVGGGISRNRKFKAVQLGGPSGGCIPEEHIDVKVDYESLVSLGAIMGSGGMVVLDQTNCMVDIARYFLAFCQDESCGKCIPCRIGTKRMLEILIRITEGKGELADLEKLQQMGQSIKDGALCGLGQTAPNPVLSTLRYFRDEYEAHITDKVCPAGVCKALTPGEKPGKPEAAEA
jgi:NADH:ubiquinone oxidoreductase subunit F (NADH-binding)/(2Fe-2S) ferredoxin